ncbi:double-strand break repair protein AddB [Caldovatus sediminis]|uniref:Double-strand break repair protein AddB n=1 Tax=Caldovatus sediminis TaxID=2041189 RepID=A0A8J3EE33_9PROT|nr:double-strand break repair protein AddB [Caldovatus sediminis]GGG48161.1 double-strand break repair protein AddB [Caldovatus sediminis]
MARPEAMRLFDIPAHLPFLDCLAAGVLLLHGDDGGAGRADPEALSRATLLLPTRRSARALREAFLRLAVAQPARGAGGPGRPEDADRAMLLPRMRALAGLSTEDADELALPVLLDLPPAVEPLRRQSVLTGFVMRLPQRHGGPATPEQAWGLAGALATLLDEIALEERDLGMLATVSPELFADRWLDRLARLVPEEHARHWQITLTFLRGVVAQWNAWLREQGLLDVGVRRVKALQAQAEAWERDPPAHWVIAAGIGVGGTIPAAAALLEVVAQLPRGAVVLHGVDRRTRGEVWDAIKNAPTHPFCSQARLLEDLAAEQDRIRTWPGCERVSHRAAPERRAELFGMALRPPEGMSAWTRREPDHWRPGLDGLSLLTAPDAQQEAVAIALLLREALEDPRARAALVTPDRDLARRVSAELARHGIVADDSAGEPLSETPAGAFLRLVARMVAERFAPVPLLSVLKHPLCAGGMERGAWLAAARLLERRVLRGPRPAPGVEGLRDATSAVLRGERDAEALAQANALLEALARALGGFTALEDAPARPPGDLLAAHLAAAEALAATETEPGGLRLYAGEEGEPLACHLAALAPAFAELPPIAPSAYPALFDAALAGVAARSVRASKGRDGGPHPRVEILGLLEARLLSFDRVVLGALDESVWPLATDPGPWMSRPMRKAFGLPEPEARIGRVCADFLLTACAAPTAVLTRAAKRGGSPTVPARWLTRIETFLAGQGGLALPASPAAAWAARLDQPARVAPCERPAPRPPLAARPEELSLSDVATLLADPYAIYARRVLKLFPLDPLDADVGRAEYGTLVHAALARFIRRLDDARAWPGEAAARQWFAEAAEAALAQAGAPPSLAAFWRPRLARIGDFVVAQEAPRRAANAIRRSLVEAEGRLALARRGDRAVTLIARADRIDEQADGRLAVVDYKTGKLPKAAAVEDGSQPQLPLEAAMALRGAFRGLPPRPVERLEYWRVSGGPDAGEVQGVRAGAAEVEELAERSLAAAAALAERFLLRGDTTFPSHPHPGRPSRSGDYDHLARVAEWAGAEDAGAEGSGGAP